MGGGGDDEMAGMDDRGRAISIEEAATMAAQKFEDELATPWAVKKEQVLRDYQVTSVRVKANFMKDEDNREEKKVLRVIDRTKARLEALEDKVGGAAASKARAVCESGHLRDALVV
jgi:hypothetical protein